MERVQGVNFARIEWCCQKAGIAVDTLLAELGIPTAAIERARTGEPSLTFVELKKVAEHFGRGALFFLEAAPIELAALFQRYGIERNQLTQLVTPPTGS